MDRHLSSSTPDYAAALATLPASDRATVLGWLDALGMEADDLEAVPPLRQLVGTMAVAYLVADMDPTKLSRAERFQEAAGALGLNGRSLLRTWYRWQDSAVRQFVRRRDDAA